jgi:hypothetical protein
MELFTVGGHCPDTNYLFMGAPASFLALPGGFTSQVAL